MGQFSVEITRLPGSLPGENQHTNTVPVNGSLCSSFFTSAANPSWPPGLRGPTGATVPRHCKSRSTARQCMRACTRGGLVATMMRTRCDGKITSSPAVLPPVLRPDGRRSLRLTEGSCRQQPARSDPASSVAKGPQPQPSQSLHRQNPEPPACPLAQARARTTNDRASAHIVPQQIRR